MNCPNCVDKSLNDGKYLCSTGDYRVVDSSDNLVFIIETHELLNNDVEINDYQNIKYCTCGYWTNG